MDPVNCDHWVVRMFEVVRVKVHRPQSDSRSAMHYCYNVYGPNHEIQNYAVLQCQNKAFLVYW